MTRSLPTPAQILIEADVELQNAYRALGDAADWLRSDWAPDTYMTSEQAEQRDRMFRAIAVAKAAINEARR